MQTLDDVFGTWETLTAMAIAVGRNRATVEKWRERGRIPQDHWPDVIAAVRKKGKQLRADQLLSMHSPARSAYRKAVN